MYPKHALDKHHVTIYGNVPTEASKIVFTSGQKTFTTFFSADGTGKTYNFEVKKLNLWWDYVGIATWLVLII